MLPPRQWEVVPAYEELPKPQLDVSQQNRPNTSAAMPTTTGDWDTYGPNEDARAETVDIEPIPPERPPVRPPKETEPEHVETPKATPEFHSDQAEPVVHVRGRSADPDEKLTNDNTYMKPVPGRVIGDAVRGNDLVLSARVHNGAFTFTCSASLAPYYGETAPVTEAHAAAAEQSPSDSTSRYYTRVVIHRSSEPSLPAENSPEAQPKPLGELGDINLQALSEAGVDAEVEIVGRVVPAPIAHALAHQVDQTLEVARDTPSQSDDVGPLTAIQSVLRTARNTALLEYTVVVGAETLEDLDRASIVVSESVMPTTETTRWQRQEGRQGGLAFTTDKAEIRNSNEIDPEQLAPAQELATIVTWPREELPGYGVTERIVYGIRPKQSPDMLPPGTAVTGWQFDNSVPPKIVAEPIYQTPSDARRNELIAGSSGAGKTEYLRFRLEEQSRADFRALLQDPSYRIPLTVIFDAGKMGNFGEPLAEQLAGVTLDINGYRLPLPEAMRTVTPVDLSSQSGLRAVVGLLRIAFGENALEYRDPFAFAIAAAIVDPLGQAAVAKYVPEVFDEIMELAGYNMKTGEPRYSGGIIPPGASETIPIVDKVLDKLYTGDDGHNLKGYLKSEITKLFHGIPGLLFGEGNEIDIYALFRQITMSDAEYQQMVQNMLSGKSVEPMGPVAFQFVSNVEESTKRTALYMLYAGVLNAARKLNKGEIHHTILRAVLDEGGGILQKGPVGDYLAGLIRLTRSAGVETTMAVQGGLNDIADAFHENTMTGVFGAQPYGPNVEIAGQRMRAATPAQINSLASLPAGHFLLKGPQDTEPLHVSFPYERPRGAGLVASAERILDRGFNPKLFEGNVFALASEQIERQGYESLKLSLINLINSVCLVTGRNPLIIGAPLAERLRAAREVSNLALRSDIRDRMVVQTALSAVRSMHHEAQDVPLPQLAHYVIQNVLRHIDPEQHEDPHEFRKPQFSLTRSSSWYSSPHDRLIEAMAADSLDLSKYAQFLGLRDNVPGKKADDQLDYVAYLRDTAERQLHDAIQSAAHRGVSGHRFTPEERDAAITAYARLTGGTSRWAQTKEIGVSLQARFDTALTDIAADALDEVGRMVASQAARYGTTGMISLDALDAALADAIKKAEQNAPSVDLSKWEDAYKADFGSTTAKTAKEQLERVIELQEARNMEAPHPARPMVDVLFGPDPIFGGIMLDRIGAGFLRLDELQAGHVYTNLETLMHSGPVDRMYLSMLQRGDPNAARWLAVVSRELLHDPNLGMTYGTRYFLKKWLTYHAITLSSTANGQKYTVTPPGPEI